MMSPASTNEALPPPFPVCVGVLSRSGRLSAFSSRLPSRFALAWMFVGPVVGVVGRLSAFSSRLRFPSARRWELRSAWRTRPESGCQLTLPKKALLVE